MLELLMPFSWEFVVRGFFSFFFFERGGGGGGFWFGWFV